jgi:hypothetical protein
MQNGQGSLAVKGHEVNERNVPNFLFSQGQSEFDVVLHSHKLERGEAENSDSYSIFLTFLELRTTHSSYMNAFQRVLRWS